MNFTKNGWYIITYWAEEAGYKIVKLTDAEAKGIKKVCNADMWRGGGYCGSINISKKFSSKAEAEKACWKGNF